MNIGFNRALTTLVLASNDIGVPDGWSTERDWRGNIKNYKHADGRTQKERPQGTSSGIVALAKALEVNRALKSADLAGNQIGDEGAAAISKALEANSTLETLVLGNPYAGNNISAVGAQAIANMLVVNRSLKSADLRRNGIPDEAKQQIRAAAAGKSITLKL